MASSAITGFDGEYQTGSVVRDGNAAALETMGSIMKSSLGPQGLDKMIVDQLGEVTITNDGSTILNKLEVQHPVAKLLVELSALQDSEVGDGTTSVVIIATELVKLANILVSKNKQHPTGIIAGYKLAVKEAIKFINQHMSADVGSLDSEVFLNVAKTTLSSKLLSGDSDHFGKMCVDALVAVKTEDEYGRPKYPVSAISVLKTHGRSTKESTLINGYALERVGRAAQGMPKGIKNAKIALIDFALKQHRAQMGVAVEITDAKELEKIREMEREICKKKIDTILASGANVIFTTQGLDDMALKYLVDAGVFAVRRVSKKDTLRISKCTGAKVTISMSSMDSTDEVFDPKWLGQADEVYEDKVGDWDYVFIQGCKEQKAMSLVIRGANEFMLDETERSIHDALCVVSRTMESRSVLAGGGCVETAVATHLDNFSRTLGSKDQSAVKAFSEALLSIPKTLCINASADVGDIIPRLRAIHAQGQRNVQEYGDVKFTGLDLDTGGLRNCLTSGVIEPAVNKKKALKYATEAAVTILRIDDMVRLKPDENPGR